MGKSGYPELEVPHILVGGHKVFYFFNGLNLYFWHEEKLATHLPQYSPEAILVGIEKVKKNPEKDPEWNKWTIYEIQTWITCDQLNRGDFYPVWLIFIPNCRDHALPDFFMSKREFVDNTEGIEAMLEIALTKTLMAENA